MTRRLLLILAVLVAGSARPSAQMPAAAPPAGAPPGVDFMALAQGALPARVAGSAAQLGLGDEQALRAIDGSRAAFTLVTGARADTVAEIVYELPAPTTFDRFAVPNVIEAPAAGTTFVRSVEIFGSATGPDAGFTPLASTLLTAHARRGEVTDLPVVTPRPVRWVRVRLSGGLDVRDGEVALEFTELIGLGTQEPAPPIYRFRGDWSGAAGSISLRQQGAVVSGCFDTAGELMGTVSGAVLRAVGTNRADRARTAFVLGVAADGTLRGLRTTGTAGFRPYRATKLMPGLPPRCTPAPVTLACGAVVHAITFASGKASPRRTRRPCSRRWPTVCVPCRTMPSRSRRTRPRATPHRRTSRRCRSGARRRWWPTWRAAASMPGGSRPRGQAVVVRSSRATTRRRRR